MILTAQSSFLVVLIARFVAVSTLDCTGTTGVSYEDCDSGGPVAGGGGGVVGGGGATPLSYMSIGSCDDKIYNGGGREGYLYSKSDFEIIITDINLNAGEELVIKSFKCNPGNVCKKAVIHPEATVPITIEMNKEKFVFVSQSKTLSVKFHVEDGCSLQCGGTFTTSTGSIQSPNYPSNYDDNLECNYLIQPASGAQVSITFTDWDVEDCSSCSCDSVEIYDGVDDSAPLEGKYCGELGNGIPPTIASTGNSLYIRFTTDDSEGYQGFSASWTTLV